MVVKEGLFIDEEVKEEYEERYYTGTKPYTFALSSDMVSKLYQSLDPMFIKSKVEFEAELK